MNIWKESLTIEQDVIAWRRWFHENPELSDSEDEAVAFILEKLQQTGIECVDVPKGGVMGFIHGGKPGKTILLRADIDALKMMESPRNEKRPKTCVSKRPGIAHTCGHDAHTAILMGAAGILQAHRQMFAGSVVLYFERGEEAGHGDYHMMKYLQDNNIHIDGCWALHVRAFLPAGTVAVPEGGVFAGNTSWNAYIGNENGNALACACAVIHTLNSARMRNISPFLRVTLSNNKLRFGTDDIKYPGTCQLSGTCRYYELEEAGKTMRDVIFATIQNTCAAYGCSVIVKKGGNSRGVINQSQCRQIASNAIARVIGQENVVYGEPAMGAESFSILSAYYPSVYALIGTGNKEKGITAGNHHPSFDIDESALKTGVAATIAYTLAFLDNEEPIHFTGFQGSIDDYLASLKE